MVHPHLEYANSVWCPHKLGDIKEIEKVQKRATKSVINLKKIPYTNRLQCLKLPALKYIRLRGDMIEVFKMTHNIYDPYVSLKLEYNLGCSTRVTNINFLIAHFATIYENIIFLHISLTFGTVCQTVLWMSVL